MELRLRVIEARGLPSMDTFGKSDPYCTVGLLGKPALQKTGVVENSNNPVWNASFTLEVLSYPTDILTIQMWDKDVAKDDKMGKLNIQLNKLPPGRLVDAWYKLTPTRGCAEPGDLHIAVQIVLRDAPQGDDVPFKTYLLKVKIVEAQNLAKLDTVGLSDPYCIVNLVNSPSVFRTSTKANTLEPVWNEEAQFAVTNPRVDILHILVRDKDVVNDDDMATCDIPLAVLPGLEALPSQFELHPCKGVKKGGQIKLVLQLVEAAPPPCAEEAPGKLGKIKKKK
jgi:Ca2+-dependent lipid-binding protein